MENSWKNFLEKKSSEIITIFSMEKQNEYGKIEGN